MQNKHELMTVNDFVDWRAPTLTATFHSPTWEQFNFDEQVCI